MERTVESTKAKRLANTSVIFAVTGLLLSSLSIKALYVIYICWVIWSGACFCGITSLKTMKDLKGFSWSRFLASIGCIFSLISILGVTFMIHEIYLINASYCRNHLFILGNSIRVYCEKHNGEFPDTSRWCDVIIDETDSVRNVSKKTFGCPGVPQGTSGYAINKNLSGKVISEVDPNVVLLFETTAGWNQNGEQELMCLHKHELLFRGSGSYIVCVGKEKPLVRFVHRSDIEKLRWNP